MTRERQQSDDGRMARICKALGNPVRLQIVRYIVHHPDCIGNDILLHLPEEGPHAQSTLSRHLRVLREASLIDAREDGAAMCYSINHSSLEWLCQQLNVLDAGS